MGEADTVDCIYCGETLGVYAATVVQEEDDSYVAYDCSCGNSMLVRLTRGF